jgi:predicted RNase H-like HicB family nuclease
LETLPKKFTYRVVLREKDGLFLAQCIEMPTVTADGPTEALALQEVEALMAVGGARQSKG